MVALKNIVLLASTAAAAAISGRDAITVESDITLKIAPLLIGLNIHLYSFPVTGLNSSEVIHADASRLAVAFDTVSHDLTAAGKLDYPHGATVLSHFGGIIPTYLSILSEFIVKKPEFAAIPGGPAQVLSDLKALNASTINFGTKLVQAEPLALKAGAISHTVQLKASFAGAIAAYSF